MKFLEMVYTSKFASILYRWLMATVMDSTALATKKFLQS